MSVFKIVGRIARTVSGNNGERIEKVYDNQYLLIRINGNKPSGIHPDTYKQAASRVIARMAKTLGFVDSEYRSEFICNDAAINSPQALAQLPSFSEYGTSDNFDLA